MNGRAHPVDVEALMLGALPSMSDLPDPLVPADVDLRDFKFMPLEINRLRKSKAWLWAKRRPELGFYMLNLWATSWHETPAASLEDDDDVLADAAMCDLKTWPKVKDKVLHGWVKCSDGRLYHPIVAEKALEAWAMKTKQRQRTAAATKARQSTLTGHNLTRNGQRDVDRDEPRNDVESEDRDVNVTFTKGQGQGQGQGRDREKEEQDRASRVATPEPVPEPPPEQKPKRKARTSLPEAFPNDDAMAEALQFWRVHARFDLEPVEEMIKFRAHHTAHGKTMADWPAAWSTWYRNALQFNKQTKVSAHDKGTEGAALFLDAMERGDRTRHRDRAGEAGAGPRLLPARHGFSEVGGAIRDVLRGPEGLERGATANGVPIVEEQSREHEISDARPTQGGLRPVQNIIDATAAGLSRVRR